MFSVRRLIAAAAFAALGTLAQSAMAADKAPPPVRPAVVVKPANPWHGVYIGGGGGWAWGTVDGVAHTDIPKDGQPTALPSEDYFTRFHPNSGLWWAVVGADVQHGAAVYGIFADYTSLNNFSGSQTGINGGCTGTCSKTFSADFDSIITVAARAGLVHTSNSLFYVLGGWSWGKGSLREFEGCVSPCDNLLYSGSVKSNGYTVGAGVEHLFHPHLSARLEYRFTQLNTGSISGSCTQTTVPFCGRIYNGTASASANVQSIRAALVLRFGGRA
jgi:outer membrane immunogenic protein